MVSGRVEQGRSTIPHPHFHASCEFTLQFSGVGSLYAGAELVERRGGDLLLMGPGIPH